MASSSRRRLVMVGAGGHARMCVEVLAADDRYEVVGAVSRDGAGVPDLGVPVLGEHARLFKLAVGHRVDSFCVAIGDNETRERVSAELMDWGWSAARLLSKSAVISPTARLEAGCQVMPAAVVTAMASVGEGTIINTNASVDHDASIGRYVHVAPGVVLGGEVSIGDRSLIGIGARVIPGISIGADATVGAGAVVVDDVPAGSTVVGIPARPLGDAG